GTRKSKYRQLIENATVILAVRVGFEPTVPVKVQRFSRPPDSTTLAPHRAVETRLLPIYQLLRAGDIHPCAKERSRSINRAWRFSPHRAQPAAISGTHKSPAGLPARGR